MMTIAFWLTLYFVIVAALDFLAYQRFNEAWKRRERARVVVGVLVVLLPSVIAGLGGIIDVFTVLVILGGFGVAGAVTLYLDIDNETRGASAFREAFRE